MITAVQMLVKTRYPLGTLYEGVCYVCGGDLYAPMPIKSVVKTTFNDYQNLHTMGSGVCSACQWFMLHDKRDDLQQWLGRDKPQSPRTYSHILKDGQWHILSKGQKPQILECLSGESIPEVCIISVSGQKHLFYKARLNAPSQSAGWVLFEESQIWVDLDEFQELIHHLKAMYLPSYGFSKTSILTGQYHFNAPESMELYTEHEPHIEPYRGGLLLELGVYLITKSKENENDQ